MIVNSNGKPDFGRKIKTSKRKMPNATNTEKKMSKRKKCPKAIDENNKARNIFIVLR
jgi:hypothetical protein